MRYLLVGGSNCVVRNGYGDALRASIPGTWVNLSLGNSPSARGVDVLFANRAEVDAADCIIFEYCLNDLIFEGANTLDPNSHALTLRAMLADAAMASRLVLVLLCGRGLLYKAVAGQSFVVDHYRKLAAEFDVPLIDCIDVISGLVSAHGPEATFVDNDHFSGLGVQALIQASAKALLARPARRETPPASQACGSGWRRVHPLEGTRQGPVRDEDYKSSWIECRMARIGLGGSIELPSPGGTLLGWYEMCSRDAGALHVESASRSIVKTSRHRFPYEKPFVAFRHLTTPMPTRAGEIITLRALDGVEAVPTAALDHTLAQVVNGVGGDIAIGELVFLQFETPLLQQTAADQASMTPSTLRRVQEAAPALNPAGTAGRYLRYPDTTGHRVAEGGMRLQQKYKRSSAESPLVSIVTVCLDAALTIGRTIQSVLAQTYPNIEYIVVDGGSRDATLDILQRHAHEIDYYVSEPDEGLYAAMNKGVSLASGDHVLILNADDFYDPDAVESLVTALLSSGADFVSARARNVDGSGQVTGNIRPMPWDPSIRLRMPLRHETMLIPRRLYDLVGGYDQRYRIIADFKFTLELFERGCRHEEVARPLMSFSTTGVSSTALDRLMGERARLMREQFPRLSEQEIDLLAVHGKLSPEGAVELAKRHPSETRLLQALIAYIVDQKSAGAKKWLSFDEGALRDAAGPAQPAAAAAGRKQLRIATLCSMDHGGAGTGTQRRVEALRRHGVDAQIYSLVVKSNHGYVHRVVPSLAGSDSPNQDEVWKAVRMRSIAPVREIPGFRAAELFSLPDSVVDAPTLARVTRDADVVHLHWVVGMLDHEKAGEVFGDKPVVWTLADMNAFTGGCHYSEGCERYKQECTNCPLLGGKSDLAHQVWKRKKAAYAKIRNLQIVCPSRWIYDRVRASSLLGDRPAHHIPNAFPIDRFELTNKVAARLKLNLPLDRKFILFGADSLGNKRKGGDQLKAALERLGQISDTRNVEVILFGHSAAKLPLPTRSLGYISDDRHLALAYSAADVFVSPSDEDSGPMTVGESLLCGTPVVAFKVGIALEMINHRQNGFLAARRSVEELALGLRWALAADNATALRRSVDCRIGAAAFHDPARAAGRHVEVYERGQNNG